MKKIATLLISAALLCIGIAVAQDQNEQASADIEERYNHLEKGKSGFKETWAGNVTRAAHTYPKRLVCTFKTMASTA